AIQKESDGPAIVAEVAAGDHEIQPAIAVNVAEAQPVVHVAVGEVRQAPAVVDILEGPVASAAQHVEKESAVDDDVGNAVVVEVHDARAAPPVAPLLVWSVRRPLQPADSVGLAGEPSLAVVEVDDDLLPFHADQIGIAVLVEVPDTVDAAFLAQTRLAGHVGP